MVIPPNALIVIKTFRVIALGEFIPYEWLTEPLSEPFRSDKSGEFEDTESQSDVLSNMGIMLLFGGVILILAVLILLATQCCKPGMKGYELGMKLRRKMLWNTMLRFVL